MATAARTVTGFELTCPQCGEQGVITIDLNDLSDVRCSECDWAGTPSEALHLVHQRLEAWKKVVRWIDSAASA